MTFQECVPNGRKILSPSHCVGAYACKILCSLHEEYYEPRFWGELDLDQSTRSHAHSTRVCGQRPSGCCADEGDELVPFHCPMPPVLPTERIAHLSYGGRPLHCGISIRPVSGWGHSRSGRSKLHGHACPLRSESDHWVVIMPSVAKCHQQTLPHISAV